MKTPETPGPYLVLYDDGFGLMWAHSELLHDEHEVGRLEQRMPDGFQMRVIPITHVLAMGELVTAFDRPDEEHPEEAVLHDIELAETLLHQANGQIHHSTAWRLEGFREKAKEILTKAKGK